MGRLHVHAAAYDFNDPRGWFTVRYPDGGYRGPIEVGDEVFLYEEEDPREGEGFGCLVKVTRVERSKFDPEWNVVYTDYRDRLKADRQ